MRTLKYEKENARWHNDRVRVAGHRMRVERSQKGRGGEERRGRDVMRESRCHFSWAPAELCGKPCYVLSAVSMLAHSRFVYGG